jgi:hypothetical protein
VDQPAIERTEARRAGKVASPGITRCEIEEPVLSPRRKAPDFAEFTLGLAEGKTRRLNPGYALANPSMVPFGEQSPCDAGNFPLRGFHIH